LSITKIIYSDKILDVQPTSGVNEDMLKKMQNELPG
jgi:hypothetical protein